MESEPELIIADNTARHRYEASLDGQSAAYSEYELEPGRIVFTHTVVRPRFEGQGVGSRLAKFVLDDARARGLRIVPVCPFVRAHLKKHPEYDSVVDYPTSAEN